MTISLFGLGWEQGYLYHVTATQAEDEVSINKHSHLTIIKRSQVTHNTVVTQSQHSHYTVTTQSLHSHNTVIKQSQHSHYTVTTQS